MDYEQKLNEFAAGKRLRRLSRPVRDRADACCDACSSTQPRILYGLKDQDADRYFFVGATCLKELVKRGGILRGYGRDSGKAAYEAEMKRRSEASGEVTSGNPEAKEGNPSGARSDNGPQTAQPARMAGATVRFATVFVMQSPESYQTVACLSTDLGITGSVGYGIEPQCEEVWHRVGERGMLLEKVRQERPDALDHSIAKAWQVACSQIDDGELMALGVAADEALEGNVLPAALPSLLRLVAAAQANNQSDVSSNGSRPALA